MAQEVGVIFERTGLAPGVGFGSAAAAAAKPPPQFLHERQANTEALCNRALCGFASLQRVDKPVTKILGVWLHIPDYARQVPDRQLQPALVHWRVSMLIFRLLCTLLFNKIGYPCRGKSAP